MSSLPPADESARDEAVLDADTAELPQLKLEDLVGGEALSDIDSPSALETEIAALAAELARKDDAIQALSAELERNRGELAAKDEQRRAELSAKDQMFDRLKAELGSARKEHELTSARLSGSIATARSLSGKLAQLEERIGHFEAENDTLREQLNRLNAQLRKKQAVIDSFDRSARRLSDLNRGLKSTAETIGNPGDKALSIEAAELYEVEKSGAAGKPAPGQHGIRRMIVMRTGEQSTIHLLTKDTTTIGRSHDADVNIADATISRLHASLHRVGDGIEIEDAGSTNGILVNDVRVQKAKLHHGDVISLAGTLDLTYLETDRKGGRH